MDTLIEQIQTVVDAEINALPKHKSLEQLRYEAAGIELVMAATKFKQLRPVDDLLNHEAVLAASSLPSAQS